MRRAVIFLLFALLLVSCDGSIGDLMMDPAFRTGYRTVTFVSWDSTETITVEHGKITPLPDNPARDGYVFIGWFHDNIPYDYLKPVTEDITLVAGWEELPVSYGKISFGLNLDSEPLDDALIVLSGRMNYQGMADEGKFTFNHIQTGEYSVSVENIPCGKVIVMEGEVSVDLDFYTVAVVHDTGVLSSIRGTVVLSGTEIDLEAEAETGWDIYGWRVGDELVAEGPSGKYTVTAPVTLSVVTVLHKWVLGFSGAETFADAGAIGSGTYVMGTTEQWLAVEWPSVHGKRLESFGLPADAPARMEAGYLVLEPGCLGDVYIDTVWADAGSPVTLKVMKNGQAWSGSGREISLRSGEETYGLSEASVSGNSISWSDVSYGTYRVYDGSSDIGVSFTVGDEPQTVTVRYYDVSLMGDEGIVSVSGAGTYPEGSFVSVSAVAADGHAFTAWKAPGVSVGKRVYSFTVTSSVALQAVSEIPVQSILPLPGVIIKAYGGYNGASYRFYDADLNPVGSDRLQDALFYSVAGTPESAAYLVYDPDCDDCMWGYYGKKTGAASNLGRMNTSVMQGLGSIEEGTIWTWMEDSWFIAGRTECDILFSAVPEMSDVPVWSSTEDSRYSAWLHTSDGWVQAGKNTVARVVPMTTI